MGWVKRLGVWRNSNSGWPRISAFPDLKITVLDAFGEQNKIAIRWILKATHEKDFADFPATHKKVETRGVDNFHFEGDKIKEAWTICDMSVLAL